MVGWNQESGKKSDTNSNLHRLETGKGAKMTTYVYFRELVEISIQEVGYTKYYTVKGVTIPDHVIRNASHQMTDEVFWNFSSRVGEEF